MEEVFPSRGDLHSGYDFMHRTNSPRACATCDGGMTSRRSVSTCGNGCSNPDSAGVFLQKSDSTRATLHSVPLSNCVSAA